MNINNQVKKLEVKLNGHYKQSMNIHQKCNALFDHSFDIE